MMRWTVPIATLVVGIGLGVGIGMSIRPDPPSSPEIREAVPKRAPAVESPEPGPPAPVSSERREPEPEMLEDSPPEEEIDLADALRTAFGRKLARGAGGAPSPEKLEPSVRDVLARLAEKHGVTGGPAWVLADAEAGALALRAVLEGAGIELDGAQVEALAALAKRSAEGFLAASDPDRPETERVALRRTAELGVENGLAELLHSVQRDALAAALDGRSVAETLPGGEERDTMSSTGVDRARATTMVFASYRRRLGLRGEPHPGVLRAISDHVTRVETVNRDLEARWGRGFVEALSSGPTPHTEAARRAREDPEYARRELQARAELWRQQAKLEAEMRPYLDEAARETLRTSRPTALRFLLASGDED